MADALYREEVARARAMEPGDKLLEGPRLFDRACLLMAEAFATSIPNSTITASGRFSQLAWRGFTTSNARDGR